MPDPSPAIPVAPVVLAAPKKKRRWPWVLVLLVPLGVIGAGIVAIAAMGGASVPDKAVLTLTLDGELKDKESSDGFAALFGKEPVSLLDHLSNLRKAAADKRIQGVLLRIESASLGWAKIEELRDALVEFKRSGKFVIAYAEQYDDKAYAVALGADEIMAPPDAPFFVKGMSAQVLHYPGLLSKLGVDVQYFRYGKYKSVSGETMGRTALTEPVKEMINHTLDVEFALFVQSIAAARKLSTEEVKRLIDDGGLRADWALEHKLIDGLAYSDEVETSIKKRLGVPEKDKLPTVSARSYRKVSASDAGLKEGHGTFALIYSQGLVVAGKGGAGPFGADGNQGSTPIIKALRKAAKDDDVKAVIFRVDSPGGAGLGCDLVRREVERTAKKKPVVVSMSDMAASGGYWVSMDASAIVAEPSTYTGSIGIWAVVPNLKNTYEKLGLNQEVFTRGAHADSLSGSRPMTDEEAKSFDQFLKASYDRFVELAAQGRHKTHPEMEERAQGRTWLGQDALDKGLIDKLGGLSTAVALAKEKAGVAADERVKLVPYEREKEFLQQLFGEDEEDGDGMMDEALAQAARRSGLTRILRPATDLLAAAQVLVSGRDTLFLMPEYRLDVR